MDDWDEEEEGLVEFLSAFAQPQPVPAWRLRPLDFVTWGATTVASFVRTAADCAEGLAELLMGQCNFDAQQQVFADQARMDMEHIYEGDE